MSKDFKGPILNVGSKVLNSTNGFMMNYVESKLIYSKRKKFKDTYIANAIEVLVKHRKFVASQIIKNGYRIFSIKLADNLKSLIDLGRIEYCNRKSKCEFFSIRKIQ